MKKKLVLFALITSSALSAMALNIKCNMDITTASKSGLMPTENIFWQTQILDASTTFNLKNCSSYNIGGQHKLAFCATSTRAIGVYNVAAISLADKEDIQVSEAALGTLVDNKNKLMHLKDSPSFVFNSFQEKLKNIGIVSPTTYLNDSLALDDAIVEASKKISIDGDLVSLGMLDCELLK